MKIKQFPITMPQTVLMKLVNLPKDEQRMQ